MVCGIDLKAWSDAWCSLDAWCDAWYQLEEQCNAQYQLEEWCDAYYMLEEWCDAQNKLEEWCDAWYKLDAWCDALYRLEAWWDAWYNEGMAGMRVCTLRGMVHSVIGMAGGKVVLLFQCPQLILVFLDEKKHECLRDVRKSTRRT